MRSAKWTGRAVPACFPCAPMPANVSDRNGAWRLLKWYRRDQQSYARSHGRLALSLISKVGGFHQMNKGIFHGRVGVLAACGGTLECIGRIQSNKPGTVQHG